MVRMLLRRTSLLLLLAALAACGQDGEPTGPAQPSPTSLDPLLAPGEPTRVHADYLDADGNAVLVAEYAAGTYVAGGKAASVASVIIKSVIPRVLLEGGKSDGACVTSTVQGVDVSPGWSYSVKKAGGCGEEIVVNLENRSTDQRAKFSFLMVYGKTRIDAGQIR